MAPLPAFLTITLAPTPLPLGGPLPWALPTLPELPAWVGELHGGQVVHHCDIDETPGIVYHVEQGLQVWGTATWTQWWGRTLGARGQSRHAPCLGLAITVDPMYRQPVTNQVLGGLTVSSASMKDRDDCHIPLTGEAVEDERVSDLPEVTQLIERDLNLGYLIPEFSLDIKSLVQH